MDQENFVQNFHNLKGTSIGEKRRNLFHLLRNIPSNHDAVIDSIVPKTYLETFFRLELLLNLQRFDELVQILRSEEEHLPAKLLKSKWFCHKLASALDENGSNFVNSILPYTSYVIRRRLLTKLAIYGTKLDTIFDELYTYYGKHIAIDILMGCSPRKIKEVLENQKVGLKPHQQKLLYQKHPKLFQKKIKSIDGSVLAYIASQDLRCYLEMTKNSNFGSSLGKRSTRKLITNHKESVIAHAGNYGGILHLRTVIKSLREEDLKLFFFNCFPKSLENLKYASIGFNNMRSKLGKRYYKYLAEGVEKVYNKSIYDCPDLINEETLESMDPEEREKWITIKRNKTSEDDLIKIMKISESLPLIKSKIDVTSSVGRRKELIELLAACCKTNNDLNGLAEVCEYVSFRHRNDDVTILRNFIFSVQRSCPLEKLDDRHWNPLFKILKVTGRSDGYYLHDLYVKHLEYLYREKKLEDNHLEDFLRDIRSTHRWDYNVNDQNLRKLLLLKSIELMPKLLEKDEKLHYCDFQLIKFIFDWNRGHPQDKILLFDHPRLADSYRKSVADAINLDEYIRELNPMEYVLESIICTKEKSQFRDETIDAFFSVGARYYNIKVDFWLLKNQPEVILANFDKFLQHVFGQYRPQLMLLDCVKKYAHLSFPDKMLNNCLERLAKDDGTEQVFWTLAVLAPAQTFLQSIAPYYPSSDKMDEFDGNESNQKEWRAAIVSSFKYTTSTAVLPVLTQYCKGDFLRYALESLYYRFYHSPENKLGQFISELSSKAVSVRKHSIFLTCTVGTVSDVRNLLQRFLENEKNASVQKHLFTAALKYFTKNSTDEFWECVKVCMKNLDRNDSESFDMLVNLRQVPEKYRARHVVFVWEILKKSQDLDGNRSRLLSSMPASLFPDFPLEFLMEVMSLCFLKSCGSKVNEFVASSLIHSNYEKEVLDAVFAIMSQLKPNKYRTLAEEKNTHDLVSSFVNTVICKLEDDEEHKQLLRTFSERWHTLFSPTDAMKEHLQLTLTLLYLDSDRDVDKFANVSVEFFSNLISTYGIAIVDCFASELSKRLEMFLCCYREVDEVYLKFCLNLVKNYNSLDFCLLVIKLLPNKEPSKAESKELFLEIIQALRQVPQESIQMLIKLYISGMEIVSK